MSNQETLDNEGQARASDPETSHEAARLIKAKATSARVLLLEAHDRHPDGLTDEEACLMAGLSLSSEYATRCSELKRAGFLVDTERTKSGIAGAQRMVRHITHEGREVLIRRRSA